MSLPEASRSQRKMTINLPETSSANTEMGASFDTLLKFVHSEMRAMFKMHHTPFLDVSCPCSLGCTIRREYHALQCPMMTTINNCVTDFARFPN